MDSYGGDMKEVFQNICSKIYTIQHVLLYFAYLITLIIYFVVGES